MFKRRCKITFIRHGSTIYTEENRLNNNPNHPPLNEIGKFEVEKITDWVIKKQSKVDKIYCSPSLASIQSARILSKALKIDFEVLDELYTRKTGIWNGLSFEQIEKKHPNMLEEYHIDPVNFWPEGGENTLELNARVKSVINKVIEENLTKRIVIITHGDVIQSSISTALDIPPQHQMKIYIPTGSASQISYFTKWASLIYSGYLPL